MWWLGGWGKIENKAKLIPSKAGARAELGNKLFSWETTGKRISKLTKCNYMTKKNNLDN
jgi:hypothetical protein